jgi:hypothetical protein
MLKTDVSFKDVIITNDCCLLGCNDVWCTVTALTFQPVLLPCFVKSNLSIELHQGKYAVKFFPELLVEEQDFKHCINDQRN